MKERAAQAQPVRPFMRCGPLHLPPRHDPDRVGGSEGTLLVASPGTGTLLFAVDLPSAGKKRAMGESAASARSPRKSYSVTVAVKTSSSKATTLARRSVQIG